MITSLLRRNGIFLPAAALFLVAFAIDHLAASAPPTIDEEGMRASINGRIVRLAFPIKHAGEPAPASLSVELIDADDSVMARLDKQVSLLRGETPISIDVMWPQLSRAEDPDARRDLLLWTRVRYRLSIDGAGETEGVRALGLMISDLFALRAALPLQPALGAALKARVIAEHPLTRAHIQGVNIEASIYNPDDDRPDHSRSAKRSARTDANGVALLEFDRLSLPVAPGDDSLERRLRIIGTLGEMTAKYEQDVEFRRYTLAIITTDKRLYQPGQTLHIRLIAYDPDARRPRPAEPLAIRVKDGDYKTVFERQIKTDRFGVASTDWEIPSSALLGEYEIEVKGTPGENIGRATVQVSRYELPTFVTLVEPDREFYLPGQDARVAVRARFVYGEPVRSGRVRVAREESRTWNFYKQQWDIEEEQVWEGETDAQGRFTVTIPLADEHSELAEKYWSKYDDPEYVARFTESTSGLSEERRFRLRVSREPIHVYAFSSEGYPSSKLPLRFFVVANYADGRPAVATISIEASLEKTEGASAGVDKSRIVLSRQVRTDRHGIALIEGEAALNDGGDVRLNIRATDANGASGNLEESIDLSSGDGLRVTADRALYRRGEAVSIDVISSLGEIPRLQLDLFANHRLIRSRTVALRERRARIEIAPGEDLRGIVTIVAHDLDEITDSPWSSHRRASTAILFPGRRMLDIAAQFDRDTVKPGEAVRAHFTSNGPDGRPRETSLGLVVYDAAVEERERTESESGQGRRSFSDCFDMLFDWRASVSDVTLVELEQLDDTKPFPATLELAARVILRQVGGEYGFGSTSAIITERDVRAEFRPALDPLQHTLKFILDRQTADGYPSNKEQLSVILARHGIELNRMRDPWGNPYRADLWIHYDRKYVRIASIGPDERAGTQDDFNLIEHNTPFFNRAFEAQVRSALESFRTRRGRYPESVAELTEEMNAHRSTFLTAKDPWGAGYSIRLTPSFYRPFNEIAIVSAGPDGRLDQKQRGDDVIVSKIGFDWFADAREKIRRVIAVRQAAIKPPLTNIDELRAELESNGIDFSALRDPWGQTFSATFQEAARYTDRARVESIAPSPGAAAVSKTIVEPITQTILTIRLLASIPPEKTGFKEPVTLAVAEFDQIIREESRVEASQKTGSSVKVETKSSSGLHGAVRGLILDMAGAVIANATLTLTAAATGMQYVARSSDAGSYFFVNLPPGDYLLRVEAHGFKSLTVERVEVRAGLTTTVDATLEPGAVSEAVMVTADGATLQRESSQVSEAKSVTTLPPGAGRALAVSTPRLRQDFPETLVWQPSLVTGADGKAVLRFNAADTITTWRMAVIGSTEDGLIGTATADLRAFLPFFIEHQPPRSLTVGDEIEAAVVVRNYQPRPSDVMVRLEPTPWMRMLDEHARRVQINPGDSAAARILFKAVQAGEFKQEASAKGSDGDRVAVPVRVRFDGRDTWSTYADLFQRETAFNVEIPQDAIPGSTEIELKVYPDLFAHLAEAIQGIVQRPGGCLEQTASAGFANLIALQYLKRSGLRMPELERRALGNLSQAIARARSFTSGGGYSYFGGEQPDTAVTAYVLRLMIEAGEFLTVDEYAIESALRFLEREQMEDGSWEPRVSIAVLRSKVLRTRLTALIARTLIACEALDSQTSKTKTLQKTGGRSSFDRALDYLARATREYDDPYSLALYTISAYGAGRTQEANESAALLASLARTEAGAIFWDVEANTPFYGWGRAGRMETTGLAVEALALSARTAPGREEIKSRSRRGLLFLLQNKDQYGVWYSTQATVNALGALIEAGEGERLSRTESLKLGVSLDGGEPVWLRVRGEEGERLSINLSDVMPQLLTARGTRSIKLVTKYGGMLAASLVARATVPWTEKDARGISHGGDLRLAVSFDRTEANQGETISCNVKAERVGSAGYGMMLAEIGLPPGVEVDAAALRNSPVSHFDVTPDRVLLYIWPKAGGTTLSFTIRPRLRINASAQPSTLYDYYNPDSRVSVTPMRIRIK